jgi:hypothetical protein
MVFLEGANLKKHYELWVGQDLTGGVSDSSSRKKASSQRDIEVEV